MGCWARPRFNLRARLHKPLSSRKAITPMAAPEFGLHRAGKHRAGKHRVNAPRALRARRLIAVTFAAVMLGWLS